MRLLTDFPARAVATPFAAGALALIAGAACAAEPPAFAVRDGLLVLPNVRIESAATPKAELDAAAAPAGMRAFKDSETGRLRAPTIEERAALAAEPEVARQPVSVRTLANGTKVAMPGELAMSYSVARRAASGAVEQDCVTGPSALAQALTAKPTVNAKKGHGHDHQ